MAIWTLGCLLVIYWPTHLWKFHEMGKAVLKWAKLYLDIFIYLRKIWYIRTLCIHHNFRVVCIPVFTRLCAIRGVHVHGVHIIKNCGDWCCPMLHIWHTQQVAMMATALIARSSSLQGHWWLLQPNRCSYPSADTHDGSLGWRLLCWGGAVAAESYPTMADVSQYHDVLAIAGGHAPLRSMSWLQLPTESKGWCGVLAKYNGSQHWRPLRYMAPNFISPWLLIWWGNR